jgi:hypothetical protein
MKKPAILGAVAVALVVLLCIAFQWRYDEIKVQGASFGAYREPVKTLMIRTNRFTGTSQIFSERHGWVSTRTKGWPSPQEQSPEFKAAFDGL